jgi:hypothetical protein
MGRKFLIAAVSIAASAPLIFAIGFAISQFMPHCTWAASAPGGGCELFGLSFNWLITTSTVAFVASFFSVPIGLLGVVVSLIVIAFERRAKPTPQQ